MDFNQIRKNLKKDFGHFKHIKIALLGDSATQFLNQAIRGMGFEYQLNLEIFEADFNQIALQVYDENSDLYAFQPQVIILFKSSHKLLLRYNKVAVEAQQTFADLELHELQSLHQRIASKLPAQVIVYNFTEIDDAVFGNYANKVESSFVYQLRKLNFKLMEFAAQTANLHIADLSTVQNQMGKSHFFQPSIYVNSEMVLSIEALPAVARKTIDTIRALNGFAVKCVILDLDNTTWGGIIGDDGIENIQVGDLGIGKAFTEFQYWVKKLKNRGIIVAICSKNTESVAKEPFEKHPDMVLRLEDVSVFVANWENKADNIRYIQKVLNIGFDSMVFIDDNPFERNLVRENISGIIVPELPTDPAAYLEFLYQLGLFETSSFSKEDTERTKLYQIEAQRNQLLLSHTNEDDFLKNLEMHSTPEPFNAYNVPRVAQLSQRSNQFNLRTIRYTESDIQKIATSEDYLTLALNLKDKFGDNGLIAVIVLKKKNTSTLFIETWLMSCRVLKRGMENYTLNTIAALAQKHGFSVLEGEYLPTAKNEMVKNHYDSLGFTAGDNGLWTLDLKTFEPKSVHIQTREVKLQM